MNCFILPKITTIYWRVSMRFSTIIIYVFLCNIAYSKGVTDDLIDYSKLDHTITLEKLRAGNHDETGINEYNFKISLIGLIISKEEKKKKLEERKKVLISGGEITIPPLPALSFWKKSSPGAKANTTTLIIYGDMIRDLTSKTMLKFGVPEDRISILTEIHMIEKNKKFNLLGEDTTIDKNHYYVVPETLPHKPQIKDINLELGDNLGTAVSFSIIYSKDK